MKPSKEFINAIGALWEHGSGAVRKTDGSVVEGMMFDETNPADDEIGIGYIVLKDDKGRFHRVYSNEFAELVKAG